MDFGAGPGGLCVRRIGRGQESKGIVLGVGGGKKGGIVVCDVDLGAAAASEGTRS